MSQQYERGKYDSEKHTFSRDSTDLLAEIETAAKGGHPLYLDIQDVDRLAGILWHAGIFQ